jgi:hypothetical protein
MSETDAPLERSVNVPLLRKTLEWAHEEWNKKLRGEISEWAQGTWMTSTTNIYGTERTVEALRAGTACGTACCIAGKVALDDGWHQDGMSGLGGTLRRDGETDNAFDIGQELLGLNADQAAALFSGYNTIYSLYRIARDITDGEIQAPPELSDAPDDE